MSEQGDGETVVSRRDFASKVSTGVAAGVGLGAFSRLASAGHASHSPDHVRDPVFDEALLERYKPRLITAHFASDDVEPSSIHGFVVRSDRSSITTTALYYWVEYPVQIGASSYESHIGDHEPFIVLLANEGTSDEYIDTTIVSGYHWLALESNNPPTDDGTEDGRPRAWVHPDYHHYSFDLAENDPHDGVDVALKDLTGSLPRWLDDPDFHDALAENWRDQGSPAYNPWLMNDKASWWRKEGLSNYEEAIRKMWLTFGLRGADGSDLG